MTVPSSIPLSRFTASGYIIDGASSPLSGFALAAADSGSPVPEPASILAFATGPLGVCSSDAGAPDGLPGTLADRMGRMSLASGWTLMAKGLDLSPPG